ncbi:MAG: hypothetical protein QMB33_03760 [Opitutales bacterium]|jgi:hypothetical protein
MSAAKTAEQEGPTLAGISVSAVLLALVGALLGVLYLASVPPTSFKSVADLNAYLEKTPELQLLDRSYFKGPVSSSRSWEQKREVLLNGSATTVELTAGEINAWMSAKFRKPSAAAAGDEAGIVILPGVPNFFIDAAAGFFLNLPTEVSIYGSTHDRIIIAQGSFSAGPQVQFQISALRVNDAAVPVIAGLGKQLLQALLQAYSQTDEFVACQQAWEKVESVELVADTMRLKLR